MAVNDHEKITNLLEKIDKLKKERSKLDEADLIVQEKLNELSCKLDTWGKKYANKQEGDENTFEEDVEKLEEKSVSSQAETVDEEKKDEEK